MKWFKHMSDSLDDPIIYEAIERFGGDAYLVFFGTVEVAATFFDTDRPGFCRISESFLRKKFQISRQKLAKVYGFFHENQKIFVRFFTDGNVRMVELNIPKLKIMSDEYTQKELRKKSGQAPDLNPEKVREMSALETETEKLCFSKEKQKPASGPPGGGSLSRSGSGHFSGKVGEQLGEIKSVCQRLEALASQNGKTFNPWKFVQGKVNGKVHPEAVLAALARVEKEWEFIEKPWGYAERVCMIQNGKILESDRIKAHEAMKALGGGMDLDPWVAELVSKIHKGEL